MWSYSLIILILYIMTIVIIVLIYQLFTLSQRWLFCAYQLIYSFYWSYYHPKYYYYFAFRWRKWEKRYFWDQIAAECEGNGTPLQYSCLENPMDRGAWWAAVHGVTKSRTWLSDFTFTFHFHALEKEMAAHSILAWRIPGMGEPGGLLSMGSHRVGHDWSDLVAAAADKWLD